MDWFSILKNQVASTKGKQFQLDFNQPMVEEEDNCKKKLLELYDKIDKIPQHTRTVSGVKIQIINQTTRREAIDRIPEEVCCEAIELFKTTESTNYGSRNPKPFYIYLNKSRFFPHPFAQTLLSIGLDDYHMDIEPPETRLAKFRIHLNIVPMENLPERGPETDEFYKAAEEYLNEVFTL